MNLYALTIVAVKEVTVIRFFLFFVEVDSADNRSKKAVGRNKLFAG